MFCEFVFEHVHVFAHETQLLITVTNLIVEPLL